MKEKKKEKYYKHAITVRLNNSRQLERLNEAWEKHASFYSTQNKFTADLITKGLETLNSEETQLRDVKQTGDIFKFLKDLTMQLNRFIDAGYDHYKESFIVNKENQVLINRLYSAVFRMAQENGIAVEKYNTNAYDVLPAGFEEITNKLEEMVKARGNTKG